MTALSHQPRPKAAALRSRPPKGHLEHWHTPRLGRPSSLDCFVGRQTYARIGYDPLPRGTDLLPSEVDNPKLFPHHFQMIDAVRVDILDRPVLKQPRHKRLHIECFYSEGGLPARLEVAPPSIGDCVGEMTFPQRKISRILLTDATASTFVLFSHNEKQQSHKFGRLSP